MTLLERDALLLGDALGFIKRGLARMADSTNSSLVLDAITEADKKLDEFHEALAAIPAVERLDRDAARRCEEVACESVTDGTRGLR